MSQNVTPNTSPPHSPTLSAKNGRKKPKKQLGWAPPTLYIPPPQGYYPPQNAPYSANYSMQSVPLSSNPSIPSNYHGNRKASEFMFHQFNGIRDFTMSTAKSGLGIGEKSAFWMYNKLSSWSKKWFTHIFLTFVIVMYTVGGAIMFQTVEGRNEENIIEVDIRAKRRILIEELRSLSIQIPQEKSIGEWHGIANTKIQLFEDTVIEAYRNHQLIVANHGPKIWTFWNAVVYCSTIYTTIEQHKSDSSQNSYTTIKQTGNIQKQIEDQITKLDTVFNTNKKEIINLFNIAKNTVEEKGKQLRRKRFMQTNEKRSRSTPKSLTEEDLLEGFRRAQEATAERETDRKRSNSESYFINGDLETENVKELQEINELLFNKNDLSNKVDLPIENDIVADVKQQMPVKKTDLRKRNESKKRSKSKNKIIEILDPNTKKVVSTRNVGNVVQNMKLFDGFKIFKYYTIREIFKEYKKYKSDLSHEYIQIRNLRRKCFTHLIILMIFCGLGGLVFKFTEGSFENFYKCGVKRVKRDFIEQLWSKSHNVREDDWKALALSKLRSFEEELHTAHEAGIHSYSGERSWSFLNGIVYCLTIVTTIGYGHLYPTTTTGQALTIVYSLIGIPLFLIILTDFGKLFTRCIKFVWSFVRRLYYTGSCRRARKTAHVQDIFKGAQMMYDIATFRRPSVYDPNMLNIEDPNLAVPGNEDNTTPTTPAISNFEIDDEFNLPISLAIILLVLYILLGAVLFGLWEGWDFFASFYFVFISMSTIGFGDYVPRHPIFMIVSIVYLVFGLALMSMCINVVQAKLSDTFSQASAKIGQTIGLGAMEQNGSLRSIPEMVEIPEVHGSGLRIDTEVGEEKAINKENI